MPVKVQSEDGALKEFQKTILRQLNISGTNKNEICVFESPGRALNEHDYQYQNYLNKDSNNNVSSDLGHAVRDVDTAYNRHKDKNGFKIYNELRKPIIIKEAEFELTDIYFNLNEDDRKEWKENGFVTRSAGNQGFAERYEDLLMQAQPVWESKNEENAKRLRKAKREARKFLGAKAKGKSGKKMGKTIQEVFTEKKEEYAAARQAWARDKKAKMDEAKEHEDFEEYTEWLAVNQEPRLDQIEAKYQDWILNGHRHAVYEALSTINQGTIFEELEEAKENVEIHKTTNVYGDASVYRVNMSPSNWASYLNTDFPVHNLCDNPESNQEALINVTVDLEAIVQEINDLTTDNHANEDILREKRTLMHEAETNLQASMNDLMSQHGQGAVLGVKLIMKMAAAGALGGSAQAAQAAMNAASADGTPVPNEAAGPDQSDADSTATYLKNKKAETAKQRNPPNAFKCLAVLSDEDLENIASGIAESNNLQSLVDQCQRELNQYQIDHITTKTAIVESVTRLPVLQRKRNELAKQKRRLEAFLQMSYGCHKFEEIETEDAVEEGKFVREMTWLKDSKYAFNRPKGQQKGWIDITYNLECDFQHSRKAEAAQATSVSSKVNKLFWSASYSHSSSRSAKSSLDISKGTNISIGFRCAKVNVTRGGWFKPHIFHAGEDKAGKVVGKKFADVQGFGASCRSMQHVYYPISFIVAKDIHIQVTRKYHGKSSWARAAEKQNRGGGGSFFFNVQASSMCQSSSSYFTDSKTTETISLNIGQPQVIGWIAKQFFQNGQIPNLETELPEIQDNHFGDGFEYSSYQSSVNLRNKDMKHFLDVEDTTTPNPIFKDGEGFEGSNGGPGNRKRGKGRAKRNKEPSVSDSL